MFTGQTKQRTAGSGPESIYSITIYINYCINDLIYFNCRHVGFVPALVS